MTNIGARLRNYKAAMIKFRMTIKLAIIYLCILSMFTACSRDTSKKHILLIQSYEANFPMYEEMKKLFADGMERKNIEADIYVSYLDAVQSGEKNRRLNIYNKLEQLSSSDIDLIVINDDEALNAFLACKHPLVGTLPVVFMGVNYPNLSQLREYPNITGFFDRPDYKTNFRLIEQLIGKCIVVRILDNTDTDQSIKRDMDEQLKEICNTNEIFSPDRVRLSGKNGISLSNVPKIYPEAMYMSTINARSARSFVKGTGENYYNKAYLATQRNLAIALLERSCTFPGFTAINELVGNESGIVGGYVTPIEEQVSQAVDRIADILGGSPPTRFPQITETKKSYVFNYIALEKWNISLHALPRGSIVVQMPFYVRHQYGLAALIITIFIIITLTIIYQRIQYKREAAFKKDAQRKLKQEKEFMSFALESGNIFTFKYKNDIFEFNEKFYRTLGLPMRPLSTKQFREAIHPDEQADFDKNRYMLDHGFPTRQIIRRRYDFNKQGYIWWEFRYAQNKAPDEGHRDTPEIEVSGLCLNIQQIKEDEQKLIEARKKAEESDQMKSVFLANMSHEIRTPLNAIVGFSQILASDMPLEAQEKSEFSDLINKNSELLLKLINDILDLSRIESGRISFSFENHNLTHLIEDVFHTHELLMPAGVVLRKKTPDKPAIIHTDRFRLTQVLTNLINNASKFTHQGYIQVGYDYGADGRSILIEVSDSGIGIPKDKLRLVFERFQKLNEFAQGTGLGLAISRSIIHTFDGSIQIESEEGKGSKFTISLPYQPITDQTPQ